MNTDMIKRDPLFWDQFFMKMAELVSTASKDTTQVGAVIVDSHKIIRGVGYNGFPRYVVDRPDRILDRDFKLEITIHAEENAILNSMGDLTGCTMYVYPTMMYPSVCPKCAAKIAQKGINEIVAYSVDDPITLSEYWQNKSKISWIVLDEAGIKFRTIKKDKKDDTHG